MTDVRGPRFARGLRSRPPGRLPPTGEAPFYFDGRGWPLDPLYRKPWYSDYVDYGFAFGPPLVGFAAAGGPPLAAFAAAGREIVRRNGTRIAPFGNRTGHATGRFPHYHRGRPDPARSGHSLPGQSPRRHRPWDTKADDVSFWDRF